MNPISYWDKYYADKEFNARPSDFATYCLPLLARGTRLTDAGCGEGQDTRFFKRHHMLVTAIDMSSKAIGRLVDIEMAEQRHPNTDPTEEFLPYPKVAYAIADASQWFYKGQEAIYSRWVLHSMNEQAASQFLERAAMGLIKDGLLLIECRGDSPPGDLSHLRRLVDYPALVRDIEALGFEIVEKGCQHGWSVLDGDDPLLIRVIARRN